ncbi:MAG: rhomboid family intramembrane serine protease [Nanoarchaeota archaeon]|nr:rhomboid family intramembrane serine protease [Nanoarchaeota archaeon]
MRITFAIIALTFVLFIAQNLTPATVISVPIVSEAATEVGYTILVNGEAVQTGTAFLEQGSQELAVLVPIVPITVHTIGITLNSESVLILEEEISAVSLVTHTLSLVPSEALGGSLWQFLTYMLMHADIMHIFLNMFVLFIFGPVVEQTIGRYRFLALYVIAGLGSAALHLTIVHGDSLLLGASGAVLGVMAVYAILYPRNWIFTFPGIPMPAAVAVVVFAILELFYGVTGSNPGVANFGHLGGIITGVVFALWFRYREQRRPVQLGAGYEFVWES